jgi:ribosome maturation factor RimP
MDSRHIEDILEKDINSLGCQVWGIEFSGKMTNQTLRVFIDKDSGVSIDDCEVVSKHIIKVLESQEEIGNDFALEVSSPGLDRKFFKDSQYSNYVGHLLKVKFLGNDNKFATTKGMLVRTSKDSIFLETNNKELEIYFKAIKKGSLEIVGV